MFEVLELAKSTTTTTTTTTTKTKTKTKTKIKTKTRTTINTSHNTAQRKTKLDKKTGGYNTRILIRVRSRTTCFWNKS